MSSRWGVVLTTALAALVVACACLASLHQRAMLQALSADEVAGMPALDAGLRMEVGSVVVAADGTSVTTLIDPTVLDESVPEGVRERLAEPVTSVSAVVSATGRENGKGGAERSATGPLQWREDMCEHVDMTEGSCPTGPREVAVSTADAERFGWSVGGVLPVLEDLPTHLSPIVPGRIRLRVVGTYEQSDLPWWDGHVLTGRSGAPADPQGARLLHDNVLAGEQVVLGPLRVRWADTLTRLDYRPAAGALDDVDDVRRLGRDLGVVVEEEVGPYAATATSSLPDLAAELDRAEDQARVIVPLLVVQVMLVGLVALVLALGATTVRMRPQVALLRLRGHGVAAARWYCARALLPAVLLGVPAGMALALIVGVGLRRWLFRDAVGFELTSGFWLAVAVAAAVLAATVLAVAHSTARMPVVQLLPRSPVQRQPRRVGALTVSVVTAAAVLTGALVSGEVTGPVGLVAPGVLALGVGLLLARAIAWASARLGSRALSRGRQARGVPLLQLARRATSAHVVAIATVSASLLVFAFSASAVAEDNRAAAAVQQLGAGARISVSTPDLVATRRAVAGVDPVGESATVAVRHTTPEGATTVAVRPEEYAEVAALEGLADVRDSLALLGAPSVAPLVLQGSRLTTSTLLESVPGQPGVPLQVHLTVVPAGGAAEEVGLGEVGRGARAEVEVDLPCVEGCVVTSVGVTASDPRSFGGAVDIGPLLVDGVEVGLGTAEDWTPPAGGVGQAELIPDTELGGGSLVLTSYGVRTLEVRHAAVPEALASVETATPGGEPTGVARTLGGEFWATVPADQVARIPGSGNRTTVVNLDLLALAGEAPDEAERIQVLVREGETSLVAPVVEALAAEGVQVEEVTTLADVEEGLGRSVPAWSFDLAVVVGLAGLLLGAAALLVVGASARDVRARDLAALSLVGARPRRVARIAQLEVLPALVIAVLTGTLCGAVGARLALDSVPFLAETPEVVTTDLSVPGAVVATSGLAAVVVLVGCAAWANRRTCRAAATWDLRRMR